MASTVSLADAWAAMEKRLTDNWPTTPIVFENKDPEGEWPPMLDGGPAPWVFCEIVAIGPVGGFGKPGNKATIEGGFIKMHVMVPKGSGQTFAPRAKAVALGEIFRDQTFFQDVDPTAYIRTATPRVDAGSMVSEDGATVGSSTCTVPYEFWHRA